MDKELGQHAPSPAGRPDPIVPEPQREVPFSHRAFEPSNNLQLPEHHSPLSDAHRSMGAEGAPRPLPPHEKSIFEGDNELTHKEFRKEVKEKLKELVKTEGHRRAGRFYGESEEKDWEFKKRAREIENELVDKLSPGLHDPREFKKTQWFARRQLRRDQSAHDSAAVKKDKQRINILNWLLGKRKK